MVQAIRAFLEFCYIARRNVHDTHSLTALEDALQQFHHHREIFRTSGIRANGFNLPRQHSLNHYLKLIRAFGAPNGLCSSITESKHIKAVKEPWRRSSRFEALHQMLLTNQRLDKPVVYPAPTFQVDSRWNGSIPHITPWIPHTTTWIPHYHMDSTHTHYGIHDIPHGFHIFPHGFHTHPLWNP